MKLLLLVCCLAAWTVEEEQVLGLRTSTTPLPVAGSTANYFPADLNDDGLQDLVLPGGVRLQSGGRFPEHAAIAFPEWSPAPFLDVFANTLYARFRDRLMLLTLDQDGNWSTGAEFSVEWPDAASFPTSRSNARLSRFLHDTDADGAPEAIVISESGVWVYGFDAGSVQSAGPWAILPPPQLIQEHPESLWPRENRRIAIPVWHQSARVLVERGMLSMFTESKRHDAQTLHAFARWRFAISEGLSEVDSGTYGPLPPHARPCRLNNDGVLDFAGTLWVPSESRLLHPPLLETWISMDGGKTHHARRVPAAPGSRPHTNFVDWNGDGRLDLLLERAHAYDGGLRESISQMLSRSALDHSVLVHLQTDAGFSQRPDFTRRLTLELDAPPVRGGPMLDAYRRGERLNMTGDFDGDGWTDLLVRRDARTLDLYVTKEQAAASKPDFSIDIFPEESFAPLDLNGDGRAEIVLETRGVMIDAGEATARILYLRVKS